MTHESSQLVSTTKEINYYEFAFTENQEENDKNKLIKNVYGLIRILDTPGLVLTKDLDTSSQIIKELDKEFNNIHLIYFFLKGQSNIEQCINILKYINNKNKEKIKKKAYKVPIIFLENGEDLKKDGNGKVLFQELKNVLQNNDLMDLYDPLEENNNNKKSNSKINFLSDDEEDENLNYYHNYIDGNIIQVHIPTGKNLNKLFLISKNYIFKNNNIILEGKLNDEYEIMEKNALSLVKLYIKEKLEKKPLTKRDKDSYKELYKLCNEFEHKVQNSGSILYNLDILNVKTDPKIYKALFAICYFLQMLIFPIFLAYLCINKIRDNLISNIALSFGFNEKDIKSYGLDKYVFSKELIKDAENNEKIVEKIKEFFNKLIYYTGPIQCAIKT